MGGCADAWVDVCVINVYVGGLVRAFLSCVYVSYVTASFRKFFSFFLYPLTEGPLKRQLGMLFCVMYATIVYMLVAVGVNSK